MTLGIQNNWGLFLSESKNRPAASTGDRLRIRGGCRYEGSKKWSADFLALVNILGWRLGKDQYAGGRFFKARRSYTKIGTLQTRWPEWRFYGSGCQFVNSSPRLFTNQKNLNASSLLSRTVDSRPPAVKAQGPVKALCHYIFNIPSLLKTPFGCSRPRGAIRNIIYHIKSPNDVEQRKNHRIRHINVRYPYTAVKFYDLS